MLEEADSEEQMLMPPAVPARPAAPLEVEKPAAAAHKVAMDLWRSEGWGSGAHCHVATSPPRDYWMVTCWSCKGSSGLR